MWKINFFPPLNLNKFENPVSVLMEKKSEEIINWKHDINNNFHKTSFYFKVIER